MSPLQALGALGGFRLLVVDLIYPQAVDGNLTQ